MCRSSEKINPRQMSGDISYGGPNQPSLADTTGDQHVRKLRGAILRHPIPSSSNPWHPMVCNASTPPQEPRRKTHLKSSTKCMWVSIKRRPHRHIMSFRLVCHAFFRNSLSEVSSIVSERTHERNG